jgi:hypothetical protein
MISALRCLFFALALVLLAAGAWARDYEVFTRPNLEFVQHDGASLAGDLYLPKGLDKAPVVISMAVDAGSRASYKYWGPSPATATRYSRSTIGSARPGPIRAARTTSRQRSAQRAKQSSSAPMQTASA